MEEQTTEECANFSLPDAFLKSFHSDLTKFRQDSMEVCEKQESFSKDLSDIKKRLQSNDVEGIDTMMQVIRVYKEKLTMLRNRMVQIHTKNRALKERSLRLQQAAVKKSADRVEKQFYEESLVGGRTPFTNKMGTKTDDLGKT